MSIDQPAASLGVGSARTTTLTLDRVWTIAVFVTAAAATLVTRMNATDLAYHIRAGTDIVASKHLPSFDTYTFTAAGARWIDQQWGAQIVLAALYRAGGWATLSAARAALVASALWFLWLACRAAGASTRTSSMLVAAAFVVGLANMGMRPQLFAYPLFTATLWLVVGRREHPRRLWAVPLLAVMWANVHGSFVLAPLLVGLGWLADLRDGSPVRTRALQVTIATMVATLVTPYGVDTWRYAISITTNVNILNGVQEWQATSVRSLQGCLFFASALAVAGYMARRAGRADAMDLLWLGVFFVLALPALRGVAWWTFVAPAVIAGTLPARERSHQRGSPALNLVIVASLGAFLVASLPWLHERVDPSTGASSLLDAAPQRLVQATADTVASGARVFVAQGWGSWFELASPSTPVFVDSRIELFPTGLWDEYATVIHGRQGWRSILQRWNVSAVVIDPSRDGGLAAVIGADPGWRSTYRDAMGEVFVRVADDG